MKTTVLYAIVVAFLAHPPMSPKRGAKDAAKPEEVQQSAPDPSSPCKSDEGAAKAADVKPDWKKYKTPG